MQLELSRPAVADLARHQRWLAREAGVDVAERMLAAANRTFAKLVDAPALGSPVEVDSPELEGLRKWRIDGFPNLRIFYVPRAELLVVARVLHSAQNWAALLDES